jgi:signal peptidase I
VTLAVLVAIGIGSVALVNGSWSVNPVVSGSMRPGFSVGGVVISERVPVDQLAVRDVIVFREPNKPSVQIVHRIVQITKEKSGQLLINTQGDANKVRDPWTLTIRGDYAYKARWSLPLVGYVAVAYENNRGVALLGAGVVLIAAAAATVWKPRRRGEKPTASEGATTLERTVQLRGQSETRR